jgi:hypothetical protein
MAYLIYFAAGHRPALVHQKPTCTKKVIRVSNSRAYNGELEPIHHMSAGNGFRHTHTHTSTGVGGNIFYST